MRISDWSSDVCSSDLPPGEQKLHAGRRALGKLRRDDAGAGLAFGELAEVAPVVEKADVLRTGDVVRLHIGKAARAAGAGRKPRLGSRGQPCKRAGAGLVAETTNRTGAFLT